MGTCARVTAALALVAALAGAGPPGPARGARPADPVRPAAAGAPAPDPAAVPGVFLSDWAAGRLGVREGDLVQIAAGPTGPWRTVRVERVYRPALYPTELALRGVDVRLHLPDLEALLGQGDQVDSIVVRLRTPGRAAAVVARLNTVALGFRAYTSADLARRNSSTFEVITRFHRAISVVAVLASSVFLVAIMALRGEELRRQVGAMRLTGVSRASIAGAVLLIATGCALLGSAAGIGLGYGLSAAINGYYRRLFDTDIVFSQVTPPLLGLVAVLSIVLGIGAGIATAWRLLRRPPLDQIGR